MGGRPHFYGGFVGIVDIRDTDRFTLDEGFVQSFQTLEPQFGPLGMVVYKRTYARTKPDGNLEDWWETVRRCVEGCYSYQKWHCQRLNLPWSDAKAQKSAQEMYRLMFDMKFLPPGRGLWMAGTPHVEKTGSMGMFNCSFVTSRYLNIDFSGPFTTLMDFSMLGVGVGFDTKGAGLVTIQQPEFEAYDAVYTVQDSREGWVELIRMLLDSYVGKRKLCRAIDYSQVRPAGSPIKGFGGVSSGHEPLMRLFENISTVLNRRIGQRITSTDIVDIFNHIGVCVVAGNVRRSAELAIGDPNDEAFFELKDPQKHGEELMSHRWASNNSVRAEVGMDYEKFAKLTAKNGEPGYVWLENARHYGRMVDGLQPEIDGKIEGFNPCVEIGLESSIIGDIEHGGGLGAETCNLSESFPSRHESYAEFQRTLKYAYLWAKTVSLLPTHSQFTNAIQMRNHRIGVSMSGIMDAIVKFGRREFLRWCDEGYAYLKHIDAVYSDWLGVPRSIKLTTVKPSGSVSLLAGVSPGIHYPHAEHYWRTMRIAMSSPLLASLRNAGYRIEPSAHDPENTAVVYFPVKEPYFDRSKNDVSIWEQAHNAADMQRHWSDNAVSITVTFKPHEADDIRRVLEAFETQLKSISFLPIVEHQYVQAPYQTISPDDYAAAVAGLRPIRWQEGDGHDTDEKYCTNDSCAI